MTPFPEQAAQRLIIDLGTISPEEIERLKAALKSHGLDETCVTVQEIAPASLIHSARNIYAKDNLRVELEASLLRTVDPEEEGLWIEAWVQVKDWSRPVTLRRVRRLLDFIDVPEGVKSWHLLSAIWEAGESGPKTLLDDETLAQRLKELIARL